MTPKPCARPRLQKISDLSNTAGYQPKASAPVPVSLMPSACRSSRTR